MCCGKKRTRARRKNETQQAARPEENTSSNSRLQSDSLAYFQYLGKTGLTVTGPRTRKRYRFDHPGAVVAIDLRDRRAMATVSILRQVEK
jgi:hypothetical protein